MNLIEKYSKRINVSEAVHMKTHAGEKMSNQKKLVTATCLNNITNFMNEAFDSSMGTQRSDLGTFKKFALLV